MVIGVVFIERVTGISWCYYHCCYWYCLLILSPHLLYNLYLLLILVYPNTPPLTILSFILFSSTSLSHPNCILITSFLFITLFCHCFECLSLFISIVSSIAKVCGFVRPLMGRWIVGLLTFGMWCCWNQKTLVLINVVLMSDVFCLFVCFFIF